MPYRKSELAVKIDPYVYCKYGRLHASNMHVNGTLKFIQWPCATLNHPAESVASTEHKSMEKIQHLNQRAHSYPHYS